MTKNKKKKAAKGYKDIDLISPRKAMAMGYHMGGSITAPAQGPGGQSPMQRPTRGPMQRPTGRRGFSGLGSIARRFGVR